MVGKMNTAFIKNILRTIKESFGRYIAVLAIVALGVGFFSGLGTARQSMLDTADEYVHTHRLYHFRALSIVGFDVNAIDTVAEQTGMHVQGSYYADLLTVQNGKESVLRCHALTNGINTPDVRYGRLPEKENECFADDRSYSEKDIGKTINVAEETAGQFRFRKYTITGVGKSPLYLNRERGTAKLADGKVSAFLLLPPGGFALQTYNELYIDAALQGDIYSTQYKNAEKTAKRTVEQAVQEAVLARAGRMAAAGIPADGLMKAQSYVLTRTDNTAYSNFESDSAIVDSIARVFPIFFLIVAALVCSTTMTRMLEDHRTQIGTMCALGYSGRAICCKYMIYSGSAALFGCAAGYYLGSWLFPQAIWKAYDLLYGFADLNFTVNLPLALVSLAGSLLCSVGVTWLVCRRRLSEMPAQLIRPRAPAAGKRIFLEHILFIWRRLSFLHKVSARNIFRFKKRMLMMLIGIGGCAALVLTGFGIHDSIANIADYQFEDIMRYDLAVSYADTVTETDIEQLLHAGADKYAVVKQDAAELKGAGSNKSAYLVVAETGLNGLVDLHNRSGTAIDYPKKGEAVINANLAKLCGVKLGDTVTVKYTDTAVARLKVVGLCENYVYNYIYISAETFTQQFHGDYAPRTAFLRLKSGIDPHMAATALAKSGAVTGTAVTADIRAGVLDSMQSLNAVVWLVILSAGVLALIVLLNLNNINITERVREIATIKVLGFYPGETASYVFRENLVLALMGTAVGLPFGVLLHRFVMDQIKIDMVSFNAVILPQSYLFTAAAVILFALISELFMYKKVNAIPMAESLKSIE